MSTKRWSAAILVILLFSGLALAGCSSAKTNESSAEDSINNAQEKVTLQLMTRADNSPSWTAFDERLAEFQKENPNIVVDHQVINEETAYYNKLKAAIASGVTPDLFINLGGEAFKVYVKNKVVADISPELDADQQWKNDFLPLLGDWQYKDIAGTYGLPLEFYAVGFFYNKEIFKQAGVEIPTTIAEMEQATDKLKSAGLIPMALGEKDIWRAGHLFNNLILKKYGPSMIDDLASRKITYDDSQIVDVFNLMKDWNTRGIFGPNIVGVDYNAEKALFFNEKTAIHMDGSWFISEAQASTIKDKIGFFPFPYDDAKKENKDYLMGGASQGLSMSNSLTGVKKDAAIKLMKFITSKDHFNYIRKKVNGGVYPVKLEDDPNLDPLTLEYSKVISSAKLFRTDVQTYDPLPQLLDTTRNALQGMMAGDSAEKAAKRIADEVKKSSK